MAKEPELAICAKLKRTLVSGITGTTKEHLVNPDGPEAAVIIAWYHEALSRIAGMTDIEADFDGFEAREIASTALRSIARDKDNG